MNILNVRNLTMSYGARALYEDVGFGLDDGERVAVIGPNGCGKSTLFKLIAGEQVADNGDITLRSGTTVGYLSQSIDFAPHTTSRQLVARAMQPVRDALAEFDVLSAQISESMPAGQLEELLERQAVLQQRIQNAGGWNWGHRVEEMLDRLGVSAFIDVPIESLSGGQRRRVGLARVLLEAPDLLLLDEPTNHLDGDAVEWLEGWLRARSGTLMLITHDRYFLENIVERILEIDDDGFYDYPGNFATFMERKEHRMNVRERTEQRRQKLMEKELDWLSGSIKSTSTRSKRRVQEIEEFQQEDPVFDDRRMIIEIPEPGEFGDQILSATGIWKRFGDNILFEEAHFSLRPRDKIGILGPNGSGKSTLLEMLIGRVRPDAGQIERHSKTDIAYLRQEVLEIDPMCTVFEAIGESDYVWLGRRRFHKKDYLDRFLFDKNLQKTQVRMLSGGQLRRLALARILPRNANLLILDEPTNDLDILSLHTLETALDEFQGCVVLISHDRYFLNRVCTAIVAVEDKKLHRYEGNYDDYRRKRDEAMARSAPATPARPAVRERRKPTRKSTGAGVEERRRLEELETLIADAEARLKGVEEAMSEPDLYTERTSEIESFNRKLQAIDEELEDLWRRWVELEEE
ncbi:MAG: ABC-F family ATP-binding cassette domain-containing protein [Bradymonadaceae bacterium]